MRLVAFASLALALPLSLLAGCATAHNDAPIIDFVDSPLEVRAENGAYKLPVTIGFHDNDSEVVTRVHYRVAPSIDETIEITTPIPTRQSADVLIVIPWPMMTHGTDPRDVEISIIDGRGAESIPQPRAITFD